MHLRPRVVDGKTSTELRRQLREEQRPLISIGGATPHHAQLAEATGYSFSACPDRRPRRISSACPMPA